MAVKERDRSKRFFKYFAFARCLTPASVVNVHGNSAERGDEPQNIEQGTPNGDGKKEIPVKWEPQRSRSRQELIDDCRLMIFDLRNGSREDNNFGYGARQCAVLLRPSSINNHQSKIAWILWSNTLVELKAVNGYPLCTPVQEEAKHAVTPMLADFIKRGLSQQASCTLKTSKTLLESIQSLGLAQLQRSFTPTP